MSIINKSRKRQNNEQNVVAVPNSQEQQQDSSQRPISTIENYEQRQMCFARFNQTFQFAIAAGMKEINFNNSDKIMLPTHIAENIEIKNQLLREQYGQNNDDNNNNN